MTEEISKAPSIRGNLKLIKELTDRLNRLTITRTNPDLENEVANKNLSQRITNIEKCIAKMAHYNGGNSPRICKEFGIENYEVKLKDMSKFA